MVISDFLSLLMIHQVTTYFLFSPSIVESIWELGPTWTISLIWIFDPWRIIQNDKGIFVIIRREKIGGFEWKFLLTGEELAMEFKFGGFRKEKKKESHQSLNDYCIFFSDNIVLPIFLNPPQGYFRQIHHPHHPK